MKNGKRDKNTKNKNELLVKLSHPHELLYLYILLVLTSQSKRLQEKDREMN